MQEATEERTTREMRMTSKILGGGNKLGEFLAYRRLPGESWMTWENIARELSDETEQNFTHEGVRRWARRLGIPLDTERTDGDALTDQYRRKVAMLGIDLAALTTT